MGQMPFVPPSVKASESIRMLGSELWPGTRGHPKKARGQEPGLLRGSGLGGCHLGGARPDSSLWRSGCQEPEKATSARPGVARTAGLLEPAPPLQRHLLCLPRGRGRTRETSASKAVLMVGTNPKGGDSLAKPIFPQEPGHSSTQPGDFRPRRKRCPASLEIRDMQMKALVRCPFAPSQLTTMRSPASPAEGGGQGDPPTLLGGCELLMALGDGWSSLAKMNTCVYVVGPSKDHFCHVSPEGEAQPLPLPPGWLC